MRLPPQENQGFKNIIIKETLDVIWVWEYLECFMRVFAHRHTVLSLNCSVTETIYPGADEERVFSPASPHSENTGTGGMK